MGAPVSEVKAGEAASAESLLESFKSISAAERRRHASVLNYWLSIRGDKEVAAIRDLDPLEISDAGPDSLLLELIGGGEDAEIKHSGDALKSHADVFKVSDAQRPSLLASIAGKLALVAISRNFIAFEDEFATAGGTSRCWVTLLPFSSTGAWVDYVYAFVTLDEGEESAVADEPVEVVDEPVVEVEEVAVEIEERVVEVEASALELEEPVAEVEEPVADDVPEPEAEVAEKRPGFSKLFDALTGFHGTNVRAEPVLPVPPAVEEPVAHPDDEPLELESAFAPAAEPEAEAIAEPEPAIADTPADPEIHAVEGQLQSKLEEVRGKADEARLAKLRSNLALYEGLGAAYDFALDAEGSPEEYLRLVEAKGLKIQLRSPMTPVVKLAFEGMCDDAMIGQLEAVLSWALKQDLPRGTLAAKIEEAGGIGPLLNGNPGQAEAA